MSLLQIDQEAMDREERLILGMFEEREEELAKRLGFTLKPRKEEKDNAYEKDGVVVYFVGNRRENYERWMCAERGARPYQLVAHVDHPNLTRALIDAINRGC